MFNTSNPSLRYRNSLKKALHVFLSSERKLVFPSTDAPRMSIVIVSYNSPELLLNLIQSLLSQSFQNYEVILVDNNSQVQSKEVLERVENAKIIYNQANLHFLLAARQGAAHARGDSILFLNQDSMVFEGTLSAADTSLHSSEEIGAVGAKLLYPDGRVQEAGSIIFSNGNCAGYGRGASASDPELNFVRDVDFCSAAFLLVRRDLFESLGGFDTRYKPAYFEDADLCVRLIQQGYRIVYEPRAVVQHFEHGCAQLPEDCVNLMETNHKLFLERHENWLCNQPQYGVQTLYSARARNTQGKRVLYIDGRVPQAHLGGGFPRAQIILNTLAARGYAVTLYPIHQAEKINYESVWSVLSAHIEILATPECGPHHFRRYLHQHLEHFDYLFVSRIENLKMLLDVFAVDNLDVSRIPIIYDAEAIVARREIQRLLRDGTQLSVEQQKAMLDDEFRSIRKTRLVLSVSQDESEDLKQHCAIPVKQLSHAVSVNLTENSFHQRKGFLFVGAFQTTEAPNFRSLQWFVWEVFPILRAALGDVVLKVVGDDWSHELQYLKAPGVELLGKQLCLTHLYNEAKVFIAPSQFSCGIPLKVIEAACYGLPTVVSRQLSDQLGWDAGKDTLCSRSAAEFAQHCIRLYTEAELWKQIRSSAAQRVGQEYTLDAVAQVVDQVFQDQNLRLDPELMYHYGHHLRESAAYG